ncbi:Uncharacterized protein FWK35_00020019 [Aphis craccivora]|uniref:Uncharacterized protein n=1 Tax=Aphis craccivora TaxID=307492 RepID=A0A6G0Y5L6_APHCR|nr:Uncharacterized protein FWK35_00020019 [Aphis craccivora]
MHCIIFDPLASCRLLLVTGLNKCVVFVCESLFFFNCDPWIKDTIDSSKRRKDGKHIFLEGRWFVTVHCNCRKSYVKENNIATSLSTTKNTRRSDILVFDFKHKCLLCEGDASDEFLKKVIKKPVQKRDRVHCVETLVFKDSLLETAKNRNDKWGSDVILRVGNVSDLVAAEGRYYGACGKQFFKRISTQQSSKGRPENVEVTAAFDFVCNYIENNEDRCQFSLREILNEYKGYIPTEKILKKRLIDKYGQDIVIATGINRQPVICFQEERLRVVKAAADIIREDIKSMVYDLQKFKTTTLLIAHSIITATRPRSFLSPIQIGLGTLMYKKYGSKELLDVIFTLGFCSSYNSIRLFEMSCLKNPPRVVMRNSFCQFVFDNADVLRSTFILIIQQTNSMTERL